MFRRSMSLVQPCPRCAVEQLLPQRSRSVFALLESPVLQYRDHTFDEVNEGTGTRVEPNVESVDTSVDPRLQPVAQGSGSVILISSAAGLQGMGYMSSYTASKYAIRGLMKSAASELGHSGVRVNSIHPGSVDTPAIAAILEMAGVSRANNMFATFTTRQISRICFSRRIYRTLSSIWRLTSRGT
jgi:NAD(P)-dependent dehydrogenase (short-subunit alcohol dehydrogenase family)